MGVGWLLSIWNGKKDVGAPQMQVYSETYLKKYKSLVERAALPKYRKEFADYADVPFMMNAVISRTHGASLELIPSEESKFQCRTVEDRIDRVVFPEKDPNTSRVEGDMVDHTDRGYPRIGRPKVSAKSITLYGLSVDGILILETGSLMTKEMVVHGIYYPNTIIINGNNQRKYWSPKVAEEDAFRSFRLDLIIAYFSSEEFREFVATPVLTQIAKDIIAKKDKGLYRGKHGYILFREDLRKIVAKAGAHGISHEFAESIYKFLEKEKTWFERHPVLFPVLLAIIGTAIFAVLAWVIKWSYGKFVTWHN
ncbi:MAG: hypothetical protein IIC00_05720 [Planctomycetes bacterium]|nr:hypothetical protein [Planctomycetota bacterium]